MSACDFVAIEQSWLPNVAGISTDRLVLTSTRRAFSGKLRVDTLMPGGAKRTWTVQLNHLTRAERLSVLDLVNANQGIRSIFMHTVGTVEGVVRITRDEHVGVRMPGSVNLLWSDSAQRQWSDGIAASGSTPITTNQASYTDFGGGNLTLIVEEA